MNYINKGHVVRDRIWQVVYSGSLPFRSEQPWLPEHRRILEIDNILLLVWDSINEKPF